MSAQRLSHLKIDSPRSREIGGTAPDPTAYLRFALISPNNYFIGMSNLGVHYVYQTLNRFPGVACERFFLDHPTHSIDHDTPLEHFPILLFSASFELDYVNIVRILQLNRIPLAAADRGQRHPVLIGGGVAFGLNRRPVSQLFDAFLLGEGETLLKPLVQGAREASTGTRLEPRKLLDAVGQLPGGEVTQGARTRFGLTEAAETEVCVSGVLKTEGAHEVCASALLTPDTEFGNRALIEIARGCPHSCTFCLQGGRLAPCRPRSFTAIRAAIDRWRPHTRRFGLVASAVGAHPQIDDICRYGAELDADVSFSSLRIEDVTPEMLSCLERSGQRSLTIAPEAGSQRLRKLLAKRLTDERIMAFAEDSFQRGIRNLKLYLMIGLPSEEPEDIEAIAMLTRRLREIMIAVQRSSGHLGAITLNANIFIPKPGTPLARLPLPEPAQLRAHRKLLRKCVQPIPNVKLRIGSMRQARIQLLLARGDHRAQELLLTLAKAKTPPAQLLKASNRELNERYGLGLAD